jgi:peptidoglycan/xylan/chitin deacetylase (PgdA/CDA1 family)
MAHYSAYSNIASDTTTSSFTITVDTTKAGSADTHFVLPVTAKSASSYFVDWGEGGAEEEFTTTGNKDHTYASSGTYQVRVRGGLTAIAFNFAGDKLKLMSIDNWGDIVWSTMANFCFGCANMEAEYNDIPNTSAVQRFEYMFSNCSKFNGDIEFDTSEGTVFLQMLGYCPVFNKPVNIDTTKAQHMGAMFNSCDKFNQDISSFDVHLVANCTDILKNCYDYSTINYDALLISWAGQAVQSGVTLTVYATYTPGGAAEAARTYLTGTKGWTISDRGPSFSNGLLAINFDDGGGSQYVAYEDLITQGERGTFYIIGSVIGTGVNLTWAQIQTMHTNGMDIQCHTYDHAYLTSLSEAQVYAEYDDNDAIFVTNSLAASLHTSYPFGAQNANVQTWTATKRLTARNTAVGYVIPGSNKMSLSTYSMSDTTDYVALKAAMLLAQNNKYCIMILSHGIGPEQTPRDRFNEIIDYAQSIGMDIVTVSELYALM